ncbi:MAG TPA: alkaline phosphatase PhoX [Polyangiaceae bacterium]|nr:alkaline phosphatase PhoX [Polyangiaceae bacterium]
MENDLPRRAFLKQSFLGLSAAFAPELMLGCTPQVSNFANIGPLKAPDSNGVQVAEGFSARIVARAGQAPTSRSSYVWHGAPDGGATYAMPDNGWIYVSNSELPFVGGVGALGFDASGALQSAYPICQASNVNCAGGKTPWGTWLTCEEVGNGRVLECDPTGREAAVPRLALGRFKHEAVAVDGINQHLYLTEDEGDGRLYRYVPSRLTSGGYADLTSGRLEVAVVQPDNKVQWKAVPDPSGFLTPTRLQVADATVFRGGEGIWYHAGVIYFSTKGDNRIWAYEVSTSTLRVLYDVATSSNPILRGVDNISVSPMGDVLVAEDGGDMQIVALLPNGSIKAIVQIAGQADSEITGPALSPDGKRLYFSSQRAPTGNAATGITYEVTGPFLVSG